MFVSRIKAALIVVLMLSFVTIGATILTRRAMAGQDDKNQGLVAPKNDDPQPREKEVVTAWGKEVNGLQAGLSFLPGEKRAYRHGEMATLVVRVRNVGKKDVKFEYVKQFLDENRPTVTDAEGTTVHQSGITMLGIHGPTEAILEPGKEIVLETRMHGVSGSPYKLLPPDGGGKVSTNDWPLFVGTGMVSLQYERVIGNSSSGFLNKLDPALEKLATGKLELEVTDGPPLSNKELGGTWKGEKDGVEVEVKFTGADDIWWAVTVDTNTPFARKRTRTAADMKLEDDKSGAVHLRFISNAKPTGTVLARLERGDGGTLKITLLPAASELNAGYKAVEGITLQKIQPEKEEPEIQPVTPQAGMQKDAEEFGKSVNGLRVKFQLDGRTDGKSSLYCTVVAQNAGASDLNVHLGVSLGNGETHHPTALRLILIEGGKKTRFTYAEPRVAGRLDPFVVPLPAGSSYTLRCPLDKFVPEDGGEHPDLAAKIDVTKEYKVVAELVGQAVTETSADLRGFTLMEFWRGTVQSNEVNPLDARSLR
jgi:hypothetical protein